MIDELTRHRYGYWTSKARTQVRSDKSIEVVRRPSRRRDTTQGSLSSRSGGSKELRLKLTLKRLLSFRVVERSKDDGER